MTEQENTTVETAEEVEVTEEVVPEVEVDGRDYRVAGNDISGYVGVSPEYMTYANPTEKPINTAQEQWDLGLLDHLEGNMDDEKDEAKSADEVDESTEETDKDPENGDQTSPPASHNPPVGVSAVVSPIV